MTALLFQHTVDSNDLTGLQSGLYYPDLTRKSDFDAVAAAIAAARSGTPADCPAAGSAPPPPAPPGQPGSSEPPQVTLDPLAPAATIACTTDCYYVAVLARAADGAPVRARQGKVAAGGILDLSFADVQVPPGDYTLSVHAASRWNPGKAVVESGAPVTLG